MRTCKKFNMSIKDCSMRQARPDVDSYTEEFELFLGTIEVVV